MELNQITDGIIGSAIEVQRRLGPGLLESAYRKCLAYLLRKRGFRVAEETPIAIDYDDLHEPCAFRADLIVEDCVVVELKAKSAIHPIDKVQTLSHLRLMSLQIGLLINFHETKLIDGLHRIVNNYSGPKPNKY